MSSVSSASVDPQATAPVPAGAATATAPRGRASWSGLLRLSLLTFPVKAYPVSLSSQEIHLNQLHAGCGQRIRYEKHCPVHGQVDGGAIARGYQYAPDQYLTLGEEELDRLRPARDKALALEQCVDPEQIDPILYSGRSLYLLPDGPAAHRPYVLLAQAMREHHKWALGRVVLSGHRHLVLVRPAGGVLTLHVFHYPAQLRGSTALLEEVHAGPASEEESKLAGMLLNACAASAVAWSPYQDDTADSLRALVDAKLQGRQLPEAVPDEVPVLHLLDALKQSVAHALKQTPVPEAQETLANGKGRKKAGRKSA
jgi:DNA end-binding protein Ku